MVFGAGLGISGMTNPAKVLAFLDVFGRWDPTLAFVMGGALAVTAIGYALARGRTRPWLAETFAIPTRRDIDARRPPRLRLQRVVLDHAAELRLGRGQLLAFDRLRGGRRSGRR